MAEKNYMEWIRIDSDKLREQLDTLDIQYKRISKAISTSDNTISNALFTGRIRYGIARDLERIYNIPMASYQEQEKPEGLFAEEALNASSNSEQIELLKSIDGKLGTLIEIIRDGELTQAMFGAINGAAIKAERDGRGWGVWKSTED